MLEINLLPGGARKKAASTGAPSVDFNAMFAGLKGQLGNLWMVGSVAAIVIALAAGGYLYYRQAHDRTVAEERLTQAQADSARYSKVVAARNAAIAKRDTLLRQVNLIRAIDNDRYIWPHIMDEVSKALPLYTWLTIMTFAGTPMGSVNIVATPVTPKPAKADTAKIKKPPVVQTTPPRENVLFRITGRTADIQAMTRFVSELEASPFLGNVFLEGTTPGNAGGDFFQFQLTISYTRPDSMIVRRVPLVATSR